MTPLASVIVPRTVVCLSFLAEVLKAMGATDQQIRTAQQDFAGNDMCGLIVVTPAGIQLKETQS